MTAGWLAPSVRGAALLRRTVGPAGARAIADAADWADARRVLASTVYGRDLAADADRRTARLAAERSAVWQIRVLAGWLPPGGAGLARLAVAPFEIGNIGRHLVHLSGGAPSAAVEVGTLGTAWPRLARATSPAEAREVLRRSSWGDPGAEDRAAVTLGLGVAWAHRAMRVDPVVRPWAMGAMSLLVARERFVFDRQVADLTARSVDRSLGTRWRTAADIGELRERVPEPARWPLTGIGEPVDLWRSELALLGRVDRDAGALAARLRPSRTTVIAVLALLLVDTWRVTAAIEAAARDASEVFDAVAA